MTITEQLHKVINELEEEINKDKFATLIFRIKNGEIDKFEKNYSIKIKEVGIEITD